MGFIKVGDPVKIDGIISDGKTAVCKDCGKPMTAIAIDENDRVKPICKCKYPKVEQLDA